MTIVTSAHVCPRCELRFGQSVELLDHLSRDHPVPAEPEPTPEGRIVLAVDPSRPDPGTAVEVAARLATRLGASLEIVAANAPGLGHDVTQAYLQERTSESRHVGAPWVSWHDLGDAPAAAAVTGHAGDQPDTWLCLASRSRTAVGEKVFGSVANAILDASRVPVVVVGPHVVDAHAPFSRVVACVDRSSSAAGVAAAAARLAARLDVRLVLVEVSIPAADGDPLGDDRHLRTLAHDLDIGAEPDVTLLSGYREWRSILDFVRDDPTTLVVTGRRPAGAPGHLVEGSVAANIARRAAGPVMVVPPVGVTP